MLGAGAGVGYEALRLAQIDQEQGRDAAIAEAPRSVGRLGGAWAGAKAASAMAGPSRPLRIGAGLAGAAAGFAAGDAGGGAVGRMMRGSAAPTAPARSVNLVPTMEDVAASEGATDGAAGATGTAPPRVNFVDANESQAAADARAQGLTGGRVRSAAPVAFAPGTGFIQSEGGQPRRIRVSQADRDASRQAAEAQADRLQPVVASANTAPNVYETTRRTARDVGNAALDTRGRITSALLNPMSNDAELLRRLENTQSSYFNKGSPQARRLMAQPYLEALGMAGKADLQGLEGQTGAFLAGANNEAAADESFASRRDKANQFNVATGERRRIGDQRTALGLAKLQQDALKAQQDAGTAISDRYDETQKSIFDARLKSNGGDAAEALDYANQVVAPQIRREGLVAERDSPYGRAAALSQAAALDQGTDQPRRILSGLNRFALGVSGGDGRSVDTFDPDDWVARDQSLRQRIMTFGGDNQGRGIVRNRHTGEDRFISMPGGADVWNRARTERDPERTRRERDEDR